MDVMNSDVPLNDCMYIEGDLPLFQNLASHKYDLIIDLDVENCTFAFCVFILFFTGRTNMC